MTRNAADMPLAHITKPEGTETLAIDQLEVSDAGSLHLRAGSNVTILAPGQWHRVDVESPA